MAHKRSSFMSLTFAAVILIALFNSVGDLLPSAVVGILYAQTPPRATVRTPVQSLPGQRERPSLGRVTVPHPNSVDPADVIQNIRVINRQTRLAEVAGIPELRGPLRASRILRVRSDLPPPGFLVVELEDGVGHPIAMVAMTRAGELMAVEDSRNGTRGKSLDLDDASARVLRHRRQRPNAIEYVYFPNVVEGGLSVFRPLVAVGTERGTIYLNSRGEAFAEEGSPLVRNLTAVITPSSPSALLGRLPVELRSLGRW